MKKRRQILILQVRRYPENDLFHELYNMRTSNKIIDKED